VSSLSSLSRSTSGAPPKGQQRRIYKHVLAWHNRGLHGCEAAFSRGLVQEALQLLLGRAPVINTQMPNAHVLAFLL